MPQAIVAAGLQAVFTSLTATAASAWASVIVLAASVAYSNDRKRSAARKERQQYNAGLKDREISARSDVIPARLIYGRDRVGGVLIPVGTSGDKGQFLHIVVVHSFYPIDGYEKLYLNDTELPLPDPDGFIRSGEFVKRTVEVEHQAVTGPATTATLAYPTYSRPKVLYFADGMTEFEGFTHTVGTTSITGLPGTDCTITYEREQFKPLVRVKLYDGTQTEADPWLVAEMPDRWKAGKHLLLSCGYSYWRLEFDQEVFGPLGLPNVSALLRGVRVYDPRAAAYIWSENAALVSSHYLKHEDGLRQTQGQVHDDEVIAGANACDEAIEVNTFYPALALSAFDKGSLDGWAFANCTGAIDGGSLKVTATGPDPFITRTYNTQGHRHLRMMVKRLGGTGWQGDVYYSTAGHAFNEAYKKNIAEPTYQADGWTVAEWDMHALTSGGSDWQFNTVYEVRFDLGTGVGDEFLISMVGAGGVTTQPRYTFNGSISSADTPRKGLDDIETAMAGAIVYSQGRWLIRPGVYRNPTLTINADSLAGGLQIVTKASRANLTNAVRATYRDLSAGGAETQAPIVTNPMYVAEDGDGVVQPMTLQLPISADTHRAQRLARVMLERSRQSMTVALTTNRSAHNLAPTDTVTLDFPDIFGAPKVFEVVERTDTLGLRLEYVLTETAPEVFSWNKGQALTYDPSPATTLVKPSIPAELEGLSATSSASDVLVIGPGSTVARVRVNWSPVTDTFVSQGGRIEVMWSTGDNKWIAAQPADGDSVTTEISPAPSGQAIVISARAVNAVGQAGPWRLISHTVAPLTVFGTGSLAPGAVTQIHQGSALGPLGASPVVTSSQLLLISFTPTAGGNVAVNATCDANREGSTGKATLGIRIVQGGSIASGGSTQPPISADPSNVTMAATMAIVPGVLVQIFATASAVGGVGNNMSVHAENYSVVAVHHKV